MSSDYHNGGTNILWLMTPKINYVMAVLPGGTTCSLH